MLTIVVFEEGRKKPGTYPRTLNHLLIKEIVHQFWGMFQRFVAILVVFFFWEGTWDSDGQMFGVHLREWKDHNSQWLHSIKYWCSEMRSFPQTYSYGSKLFDAKMDGNDDTVQKHNEESKLGQNQGLAKLVRLGIVNCSCLFVFRQLIHLNHPVARKKKRTRSILHISWEKKGFSKRK